jgi:hypothetical protein
VNDAGNPRPRPGKPAPSANYPIQRIAFGNNVAIAVARMVGLEIRASHRIPDTHRAQAVSSGWRRTHNDPSPLRGFPISRRICVFISNRDIHFPPVRQPQES